MLDQLYVNGLDHAPNMFDLRSKLLGQDGCNIDYIRTETGVAVILKGAVGNKVLPLHFIFIHDKIELINAAKVLAQHLIDSVKEDLKDFFKNTPPVLPPPLVHSQPSQPNIQNTPVVANNTPPILPPPPLPVPVTSLASIQQTANVISVQPQTQILQIIPNQQIFVAQDGTQYVSVKVAPNSTPVAQLVGQNQIVLPQNMSLNGSVLNVQPLTSQAQAPSVPVIVQANVAVHPNNVVQTMPNLSCNMAQSAVAPPTPAPVPPPVQNVQWASGQHDMSQLKYMVTQQVQGDGMQWTTQVNSHTTLVQNQQLAITSHVPTSDVHQGPQSVQRTMPWTVSTSEVQGIYQPINQEQIKRDVHNILQNNTAVGWSQHSIEMKPEALSISDTLTRNSSSKDVADIQTGGMENFVIDNDFQFPVKSIENPGRKAKRDRWTTKILNKKNRKENLNLPSNNSHGQTDCYAARTHHKELFNDKMGLHMQNSSVQPWNNQKMMPHEVHLTNVPPPTNNNEIQNNSNEFLGTSSQSLQTHMRNQSPQIGGGSYHPWNRETEMSQQLAHQKVVPWQMPLPNNYQNQGRWH